MTRSVKTSASVIYHHPLGRGHQKLVDRKRRAFVTRWGMRDPMKLRLIPSSPDAALLRSVHGRTTDPETSRLSSLSRNPPILTETKMRNGGPTQTERPSRYFLFERVYATQPAAAKW